MAGRTSKVPIYLHTSTSEERVELNARLRQVSRVWVTAIRIGGVPLTGGRPTDEWYTIRFGESGISYRTVSGTKQNSTDVLSGIVVPLTGTVTTVRFNPPLLIFDSNPGIDSFTHTTVEVRRQNGTRDDDFLDSCLIELQAEANA